MKKITLLLPFCFFSGCAVVTPHPTSMTLTPQAMEIVGPAKGESSNTRLLCVLPVSGGSASLIAATENAVRSVGADAIVNPAVDDERGIGFLGLWCWQKIKVYGTAVRFKRNAAPPAAAAPVFRTEKGQAQVDKGQVQSEIDSISEMENRIFKSK